MCFEYIHLQDWGLSWPWLTLGNVFATNPEWIQWYEYTGISGGTLWIMLSNILLFCLFLEYQKNGRSATYFKQLLSWLLLIILPFLFSRFITPNFKRNQIPSKNVVVVQPNIDPYEKVSEATGSFEAQLQRLINTTEKEVDSNTALIVWPETALYTASRIDEAMITENYYPQLFAFLKKYPTATLFTGIESFRRMPAKTKYSQEFNGEFYESYNGSALLDSNGASAFYHKSMLVPGVETLPWFLKFIDKWFEKFGGTTAGYAKQDERTVLSEKNGFKIAPSICYESIYGDFMRKYIRNGANLICIITNDGWWKKTPGHKQHMNYARLRAIETRTWVARSANTGISCFIDPYGTIFQPQPYNTNAAIKMNLEVPDNKKTFYVIYGDLLSKIMTTLSILLITIAIAFKIKTKLLKSKTANQK